MYSIKQLNQLAAYHNTDIETIRKSLRLSY